MCNCYPYSYTALYCSECKQLQALQRRFRRLRGLKQKPLVTYRKRVGASWPKAKAPIRKWELLPYSSVGDDGGNNSSPSIEDAYIVEETAWADLAHEDPKLYEQLRRAGVFDAA